MKLPHVYIVTNHKKIQLKIGITEDLAREIFRLKKQAHQLDQDLVILDKLVWYKSGANLEWITKEANRIETESHESKLNLIRRLNPQWKDLYQDII